MNALLKSLLARAGMGYRGPEDDDGSSGGDVQHTDDGAVIGTGNDARLKMLDQIADQSEGVREEEMVDVVDIDKGLTEPFKARGEENPDDDDHSGDTDPAGETPAEPAEPEQKIKIKVNGVEKELTLDELKEKASKVDAADAYLEQAAELRRQAEQQNKPNQPSDEDVEAARLEKRRAMVRAIQMGTEEEALAALEELSTATGKSKESFDKATLFREIDERQSFKAAVAKFESDFADIVADPYLSKLAVDADVEMVNKGDKRGFGERFTEIGTKLREWKKGLVTDLADQTNSADNAKQLRKAEAARKGTPNTATARAPSNAAPEEPEQSNSDVIAAMARQRGGPQFMR